jgi:hypothetical protein
VPKCGDPAAIDIGDIIADLSDPTVQKALFSADPSPFLFGLDTRPVDGRVFSINRGNRQILIGEPCNGASGCTQAATTVACGAAVSCSGNTYQPQSFCNGSGTCSQLSTMACAGHLLCNAAGTACLASCNNTDSDCVGGNYCTGPNGSCLPKGGAGATCGSNHECTTGNCVDGVCCNFATCGTCTTCNGSSPGNCTPLGTPATPEADPHGRCPANPPCGNTGMCVSGACQQVAEIAALLALVVAVADR